MKQKITEKDFRNADVETKNKMIDIVSNLETHNCITKNALVEMIKYQKFIIELANLI